MKQLTSFSLSIQREIERQGLNWESEINKAMTSLKIPSLMRQCGIKKLKGYSESSLLYLMILLPIIKESLSGLISRNFLAGFIRAHKDAYYRFLNRNTYNWRKLLMLIGFRQMARTDTGQFDDKVLVADDTFIPKTGEDMELVSYHYDHSAKRSRLGFKMLQLGCHDGTRFYPLDISLHTSKKRANKNMAAIDGRTCGWKRRMDAFNKKTDVLVQMVKRCWQSGISARFILFDSWFAHDSVISSILKIGYGVICRLKRGKAHYQYGGRSMALSRLWHDVARHQLRRIHKWNTKATYLDVQLPLSGQVRIVFVRWSKKNWHAFLCTEVDMEISEILDYYSRRWTIEVYFRDCKQLLELGKGQSMTFDATIAWASIVVIRYLLLGHILAKRQLVGPIGPLFQSLGYEHIQAAMFQSTWTRIKQIFMLSSQLLLARSSQDEILYMLDLIEEAFFTGEPVPCAKL